MAITPSLKHTWTSSIKNDSGVAVVADPPLVITADAEINFCVQVPASETAEVDAVVDVTKIKSGFLVSNQATDIFTNDSTGATGQVIHLLANQSVAWHDGMITVNPFTPTITKFYCKNNGTAIATVRGGFLIQE